MSTRTANLPERTAKPLTPKEQRFVDEYLACLEPRQAALKAGYAPSVARANAYGWACDIKSKPRVFAAIEAGKKARAEAVEIQARDVLRHWWDVANADPNELTELRRVNCRECHGIGGKRQWIDQAEFTAALASATMEAGDNAILLAMLPTDEGGYGFDGTADPNPACQCCRGEGVATVHLADTRKLSRSARRLFAGVTRTKDGVNIKMHDQMKALEMVARHLGMFNDQVTLKGDAENPLTLLVQQLQGSSIQPGQRPRGDTAHANAEGNA